MTMNYTVYPILFTPISSNNFSYSQFGANNLNALPNFNNNSFLNYTINNNSIGNNQGSSSISYIPNSKEKNNNHCYDNFGEDYNK